MKVLRLLRCSVIIYCLSTCKVLGGCACVRLMPSRSLLQRAFPPQLHNHHPAIRTLQFRAGHHRVMNMYGKRMGHDSRFHLSSSFPSLHLLPHALLLHCSPSYLHTRYSTALFLISYLRHPVCSVAQSAARLQPKAKLSPVPCAPLASIPHRPLLVPMRPDASGPIPCAP